ncbi:MAG: hypothetical protein M3Z21_06555 [Pseudomonadota bacterium]|nr:hypothetical protein [Pseudomonadota bacterium]
MLRRSRLTRIVLLMVLLAHLLPGLPLAHAAAGHVAASAADATDSHADPACPHSQEAVTAQSADCQTPAACCCAHNHCAVLPALPHLIAEPAAPLRAALPAASHDFHPPVELKPPRALRHRA